MSHLLKDDLDFLLFLLWLKCFSLKLCDKWGFSYLKMRHQNWSLLKEFVLQLSKDDSFNAALILGIEPRNLKLAAFRIQVWTKWKKFSLPQEVTEIAETVNRGLVKLLPSLKPTFQDCLFLQGTESYRNSELKRTREGILYKHFRSAEWSNWPFWACFHNAKWGHTTCLPTFQRYCED